MNKLSHIIIVVDNCSTNNLFSDVISYIENCEYQDKIVCIKSDHNGGYAYGNNLGIKYAIEKYGPTFISVSNSDVILSEESIGKCISFLRENHTAALVAPLMKSVREEPIKSYWNQPTYSDIIMDNLIFLSPLRRKLNKNKDRISDDLVIPVDVIIGSYYMASKNTFEEINFLDEKTFLYCEENILGYKIKKINKQSYILRDVDYIHNHSASINKNISSVSNRLSILHQSNDVYLKDYLCTNTFKRFVFEMSYYIGKWIYLIGLKILKIQR